MTDLIRGDPTGSGGVAEHRVGKIVSLGIVHGTWLDCGCADGRYSFELRNCGAARVTGCDIEPARVGDASIRWQGVEGLDFVPAAAERLPFRDGEFDGVFLNEVLEHVRDEGETLREIHRVLVPGGHIVVFSPNRWFPFEGHGAHIGSRKIEKLIPILPWLPARLTTSFMTARNYWPRDLVRLVSAAGFSVEHVGFAFPLLNRNPWLPPQLLPRYRALIPFFETNRLTRRFGVSTMVVGKKASGETYGAPPSVNVA